jgi:hypothetical protein
MARDARPLRLVRHFPVRSRDRGRLKPEACVCPDWPHPFCRTVTCRCDHGFGAP